MGGSFSYLIDPDIYYSATQLDFIVSTFLYLIHICTRTNNTHM